MKKKLAVLICYVLLEIAEYVESVELECKKEGYAVEQSDNCAVYYYCVKIGNDEFFAVKFECPLGEEFSLLKLMCIPEAANECGKSPDVPFDDPILSEEFVCPSSGRFPDFESPDCKSYYMCSSTLIPALSNCPSTTIFSWESMKCVVPTSFTCPNAITTTSEATTITTEETTNPDGFVCSTEGRFADPQSVDCKSYYLCLATVDGSFDAVLSQCPSTTVFSPETQKCVVSNQYECPAATSPTDPSTTELTSTTEESTTATESTTDVEVTTEESSTVTVELTTSSSITSEEPSTVEITVTSETPTVTTPELSSTVLTTDYTIPSTAITSTNQPSTSETDEPTSSTPGESFACSEQGRFPDPQSTDCKGYYLCTENTEGIFEATLNRCPSVTIFHPENRKCVQPTVYECPSKETTTPDPTEQSSTVEPTVPSSEAPTVTTPESASTNEPSTSETDEPTPDPSDESFACTEQGRFPDPKSTDCKSYYLCTENTEGNFEASLNRCPSVTIFHPENRKCVQPTVYECPTAETTTLDPTEQSSTVVTTVPSSEAPTVTTPESASTNEPSTSETDEPTPDPSDESFACTEQGRFPDPKSTDCKSYYLCTENTEGNFEASLNRCPSVTIFHPENRKCVQPTVYECPTAETTTPDPTEQSSTVETTVPSSEPPITVTTPTIPTIESFVCTAVGRFPDPTSSDCKGYYLCSTTVSGTYEAVLTQCPSSTIFSAEQYRCVLMSQYQCPTATETTTATAPPTTTSPGIFTCTSTGRYPDPTQPDCSKYKYCLVTATNEFLEYTFNCPSGSYFNPLEHRCSADYSCPDRSSTAAPETTTELTVMTTPFYCTADGRFPDPTSEDCDTYIMCLRTAVGNFLKYDFKCPSGSLFSPADAKCSTSYVCV